MTNGLSSARNHKDTRGTKRTSNKYFELFAACLMPGSPPLRKRYSRTPTIASNNALCSRAVQLNFGRVDLRLLLPGYRWLSSCVLLSPSWHQPRLIVQPNDMNHKAHLDRGRVDIGRRVPCADDILCNTRWFLRSPGTYISRNLRFHFLGGYGRLGCLRALSADRGCSFDLRRRDRCDVRLGVDRGRSDICRRSVVHSMFVRRHSRGHVGKGISCRGARNTSTRWWGMQGRNDESKQKR